MNIRISKLSKVRLGVRLMVPGHTLWVYAATQGGVHWMHVPYRIMGCLWHVHPKTSAIFVAVTHTCQWRFRYSPTVQHLATRSSHYCREDWLVTPNESFFFWTSLCVMKRIVSLGNTFFWFWGDMFLHETIDWLRVVHCKIWQFRA